MNDTKKYGTIINEKFREFLYPDMDATWPDMKALLDQEMPEKKRRGFILWFDSYRVIVLSLVVVSLLCVSIYIYKEGFADENQENTATLSTKSTRQPKAASPVHTKPSPAGKDHKQPIEKESTCRSNQNKINSVLTEPEHEKVKSTNAAEYDQTAAKSSVPKNIRSTKQKEIKRQATDRLLSTDITIVNEVKAQPTPREKETRPGKPVYQSGIPADYVSSDQSRNITNDGLVKALEEKRADIKKSIDNFLKSSDQLNKATVFAKDSAATKQVTPPKIKGWVAGASINYNLPVSDQEMSTVNINGKKNMLIDFLPSLYVQYHVNQKWHLESSFEFSSPQYISSLKLSSEKNYLNSDKCEEKAIWLNKLYYLNIPVSVHFQPLPDLTIGTGIQYSYLKRSIFNDEMATWEKGPAGWTKTASVQNIKVRSNSSGKVSSNNGNIGSNGNGGNGNSGTGNGGGNNGNGGNGNGNGNNGGSGNNGNNNGNGSGSGTGAAALLPTRLDTVAQTLRSSDWRLLFDVNYRWRRINAGLRFNFGLDNYINTKTGSGVLAVKDRNQALQLYLRFDILDRRKK